MDRNLFCTQVRDALHHLYDSERLSRLPLAGWLRAEPDYASQRSLRRILEESIDALRPERGTPPDTPNWRAYHILFYRFVQCMTVGEVASQIGLGQRHFRRHQARAIRLLADRLWAQAITSEQGEPSAAADVTSPSRVQPAGLDENLAWLVTEGALQRADLAATVPGVEGVLAHLVSAKRVRLEWDVSPALPPISIHPSAMRQILVSSLSFVAGLAPGSRVGIQACLENDTICIRISSDLGEPVGPPASDPGVSVLAVPRQLLGMYRGSLQVLATPHGMPALLIRVPVARRLPVLIVDDNADAAALFSRHLAESRYRPMIAHSGHEALALLERSRPDAIVLDVMMPDQDGWETLILFKAHPATATVPVIVATVLNDRDLALSLGAAAFLHKPVSQDQLLAALDRAVESHC